MKSFLSNTKKALAALVGIVGILISTGYLSGQTEFWVNFAVGLVSTVLVYVVKNVPVQAKPNA